ncbi:MAG TPA: flagellar basal body L-ring protein FlgH [Hyphomicrobiaceae bacterium]
MMRLLPVAASCIALQACGANFQEIGVPPALSPVGSGIHPAALSDMQYPQAPSRPVTRFSLWDDKQSQFYTDARAINIGDILTVEIRMNDRAEFENESKRKRDSVRTLGLAGSYSAGSSGSSASLDGQIDSVTSSAGSGSTERSEEIKLRVAAVVTGVLPNGNLRISGSQEVRVNAELRVLTIEGIVRPSDIGSDNTVSYDRIAEARISYGGRGRLTEVQQPPYGQQILDQALPF